VEIFSLIVNWIKRRFKYIYIYIYIYIYNRELLFSAQIWSIKILINYLSEQEFDINEGNNDGITNINGTNVNKQTYYDEI